MNFKIKTPLLMMGLVFLSFYNKDSVVSAYERSIEFSGYEWEVRNNEILENPGPNYFSDSSDNVWVDSSGRLHLKLTYLDGKWYGAEIINKEVLGYGKYTFHLEAKLDQLDSNVVLGLFTYDMESTDAQKKAHREIDIEFAEWGNVNHPNSQYTIWHSEAKKKAHTYDSHMPHGTWSTHSFDWQPKRIDFESSGGHHKKTPDDDFIWQSWSYKNKRVPNEGLAKIHMNLWLFDGQPPKNNQEVEVIISEFTFEPYTLKKKIKGTLRNIFSSIGF